MFEIHTSPFCRREKEYVIKWILNDVFGLSYTINYRENRDTEIRKGDRVLKICDTFFPSAEKAWCTEETLFKVLNPVRVTLNSQKEFQIFNPHHTNDLNLQNMGRGQYRLNVDVLGIIFYFLSRYEELVVTDLDAHERFPSQSSLMGRSGCLDRPLCNEYIELLWASFELLWPGIQRKTREFRVLPSHDIDHPSDYWGRSRSGRLKVALKSAARRLEILSVPRRCHEAVRYPAKGWRYDPKDTIDFILDLSESAGRESSFYYIPLDTSKQFDPGMPIEHPQVEDQWRRIHARGHKLGIHPGYMTCMNSDLFQKSVERFQSQFNKLGLKQDKLGGRHHYLRWNAEVTPSLWQEAGLDYDSTMGYADHAGFRSGTCYEYPLYDVKNRRQLSVLERPLIVMECSVIDDRYMGMGRTDRALEYMLNLKEKCKFYQGDFTILWHNQRFKIHEEIDYYKELIS